MLRIEDRYTHVTWVLSKYIIMITVALAVGVVSCYRQFTGKYEGIQNNVII